MGADAKIASILARFALPEKRAEELMKGWHYKALQNEEREGQSNYSGSPPEDGL